MKRFRFFLAAGAVSCAAPASAQTAVASLAPGQSVERRAFASDAQRRSGKYEDVYLRSPARAASASSSISAPKASTPIWW